METRGRNGRGCGEKLLAGLLPRACTAHLLRPRRTTYSGVTLAVAGGAMSPPTSIIHQESGPTNLLTGNPTETFLQLRFLLTDDFRICQADKKLTRTKTDGT